MQPQNASYLTDDDILIVSKPLAKAVGIGESIILRRLHFWLDYNSKDKAKIPTHFRDEKWWSYNTYTQWAEDIQIYSDRSIRRYFETLEALGLVVSTNEYNSFAIDNTKWYSIDYDIYETFLGFWTECGQPITNGGTKSEAYMKFIVQWNEIFAQIAEIRTNPPIGQSGQTDSPDWTDHVDNLDDSESANLSTPLPVSPISPTVINPSAVSADGIGQSSISEFKRRQLERQMKANISSLSESTTKTKAGTLKTEELAQHPMVVAIEAAAGKTMTKKEFELLTEGYQIRQEDGGFVKRPSRLAMYERVLGFKDFFSFRVLTHTGIGKGMVQNIENLIRDLRNENRPDTGWDAWKAKNPHITMRNASGATIEDEESPELTEDQARKLGLIP